MSGMTSRHFLMSVLKAQLTRPLCIDGNPVKVVIIGRSLMPLSMYQLTWQNIWKHLQLIGWTRKFAAGWSCQLKCKGACFTWRVQRPFVNDYCHAGNFVSGKEVLNLSTSDFPKMIVKCWVYSNKLINNNLFLNRLESVAWERIFHN